jgi:uncharacterized protein
MLGIHALLSAMAAVAAFGAAAAGVAPDTAWSVELAKWRETVDASLRKERGWLSIVGRWELAPGSNRIGSAAGNDVVLPKALAPATLGTINVADGKARLVLASGTTMRVIEHGVPGDAFAQRDLLTGEEEEEWITSGRLSLMLVRREDGKFVLRAADRDSPRRKNFPPRAWYDARPDFRIPARFIPQPKGTKIPIANVRGEIQYEEVAGQLEFVLDGATVRLDALDEDGDVFVIFRDATSEKGTYPAGRFLHFKRPDDGVWFVDFNRAFNPPCSFSAYTTCPLPPPQNWIKAAIPAGEKYPGHKS